MKTKRIFRTGNMDGRAVMLTAVVGIVVIGIALWLLFSVSERGSYLLGWYVAFATAVICLCLLSMPSRVLVSNDRIELRGVLNTIYIPLGNVRSIEEVESLKPRILLTLGGIYGLGGYYGMFYDLHSRVRIRLFTKRRNSLVEIVDRSKNVFVVSTDDNDRFVELIRTILSKLEKE